MLNVGKNITFETVSEEFINGLMSAEVFDSPYKIV